MQFNKVITIAFNAYNDFGEPVEKARKPLRCCIIEERLVDSNDEHSKRKAYDLKIVTPNKAFAPYKDIFTNESITCEYEGKIYEPVIISAIKDLRGNTKYFEVEFKQART